MKLPDFINILKSLPEDTQISPVVITEHNYKHAELLIAGFTNQHGEYKQLPIKDFPVKLSLTILYNKEQHDNVIHQMWLAGNIKGPKKQLHLFFESPKWNNDFLIWEGKSVILPNDTFQSFNWHYSYKVKISIK